MSKMNIIHLFDLERRQVQIEDALEGSLATDFEMAKLWVPSEKISIQIIDVPTAPRRKWREIIPWMLEDIVLQNVSDIHYEIIDENSGKLTLLIISTECLENWQRIAKNAAVNAISMAPDYLAVPFDKNTISVGWREGVLLVRTSRINGFAAKPSLAWPLIERFLDENSNFSLSISIPDTSLVPKNLLDSAKINNSEIDWTFGFDENINVLPSQLKMNNHSNLTSKWLLVACIIILSFGVSLLSVWVGNNAMEKQIELYETSNVDLFKKIFNETVPSSSALRGKAESNIKRLFEQNEALNSPIMRALYALQPLMTNCGCELVEMDLSESSVQLQIRNASSLIKRPLKVDGYKIVIDNPESSESDVVKIMMALEADSNRAEQMNDMLSRIKEKFNLLQKRERKLLLLGFGLISISIVYLSIKPLFMLKEDLNEDLKASKADFLWMTNQIEVVLKLRNSCSSRNYKRGTSQDQITNLARRNLISVDSVTASQRKVKASLSGSDSNRFLDFYSQFSCAGYLIEKIEMKLSPDNIYKVDLMATQVEY